MVTLETMKEGRTDSYRSHSFVFFFFCRGRFALVGAVVVLFCSFAFGGEGGGANNK